jgi:hypothetical protein
MFTAMNIDAFLQKWQEDRASSASQIEDRMPRLLDLADMVGHFLGFVEEFGLAFYHQTVVPDIMWIVGHDR